MKACSVLKDNNEKLYLKFMLLSGFRKNEVISRSFFLKVFDDVISTLTEVVASEPSAPWLFHKP
jgi:hypothetical protein